MPPANRHEPRRAKSSTSDYSVAEFLAEFPDDAAGLEHLWRTRHAPDGENAHCPKCWQVRPFKRYKTKQQRQSWTCTACGHHLHPTAGTIFHRSSTSLRLWFPRLVPGGKPRRKFKTRKESIAFREAKPTVLGMVERGGRVRARVIPTRFGEPLSDAVRANVNPEAILYTDDWLSYRPLAREYAGHRVINHSAGSHVEGDIYTNTIEGFFGNLKTEMRGTYKKISRKWLQSYLDEYA
jgi:transposase-like protein